MRRLDRLAIPPRRFMARFRGAQESIHRKSNGSEQLKIYFNEEGTLDVDLEQGGEGLYLSAAWTGNDPGGGRSIATWLRVVGCGDTRSAMDVARCCPQPTLCWVFADCEGHIGMQGCGSFPVRRQGVHGLLPIPAWDERNHWQGRVPCDRLPRIYDPPEGFVATANNSINPPGGPELITLPVPDYRYDRIVERLHELPRAELADMQRLQYDVLSLQARRLLKVFLPHIAEGPVKDRLAAWDCRYTIESVEASLFARLYRNVLLEIFGQAPSEPAAALVGGGCFISPAAPASR